MKDYEVQTITVLSRSECLYYVETKVGGFIIGSTPQVGDDAREANILRKCDSLKDAETIIRNRVDLFDELTR